VFGGPPRPDRAGGHECGPTFVSFLGDVGTCRRPVGLAESGEVDRSPERHPRAAARAVGSALLVLTVVTVLASAARPPVDQMAYIWLRLHGSLPSGSVGTGWWVAVAAVEAGVLILLGRSCRRLLLAVPFVVLGAAALARVLQPLLDRDGPFDRAVPWPATYPTPMAAALGSLVVLAPVAVRVATGGWRPERRPAVESAAAVVSGMLALGLGWVQVRLGTAWPLDVVGGLTLGALVASTAWLWLESTEHRCPACPWRDAPVRAAPATDSRWRYRLAVVWSLVASAVLLVLAMTRGIPRLPESGVVGNGLELPLSVGMVVLLLLGTALASRWHLTGALLVGLASLVLGYFASVQYQPVVSVLVLAATFPPAYLLWSRWHPTARLRGIVGAALVTSLVLGAVVWGAARTNAYYWGPDHPRSPLLSRPDPVVAWSWAGGVTPRSVTVTARTWRDAADVRLVLSRARDVADGRRSGSQPATESGNDVVSWTVRGLRPSTRYHYGFVVDGVLSGRVGTFRTFPATSAAFTFAVSADARTGSSGRVFDVIRGHDPLLFLNLGDFFYGDVDTNDPARYLAQYDDTLRAPAQAALYRRVPIAYTWGDHDYGANDADMHSVSRPAALATYRQVVPHYSLGPGPDAPIFQAFTVGDVRFVLTDNRSRRDASVTPGTMLGREQLTLLTAELRRAGRWSALVWANADPWVDRAASGKDTWGGFAEERRRIAGVIARHDVDNLLMVSGDAHMLAFDDGSHTDYSGSGRTGFPLLQAAALDRKPSVKGGPYSGPVLPGSGQFGLVRVAPGDDGVRLTVEGVDWHDRVLFRRVLRFP
jgi:hypothetical protein